jgi:hypothetical protein
VILVSGLCAATARALPTEGLDRLARYDVLSFAEPAGDGFDKSRAIGVFDATPDEVFRTATDYSRLAEFAPRLRTSRVLDRPDDGHALVALTTNLPWPVRDAWAQAVFVTEKLPGEVYQLRFWQVRGTMKRYQGSMLIEPYGPGRTAVTYEVFVEPSSFALRGLVNRKLQGVAAGYVHALRQRINDLHRLGRLHPQQPATPGTPSMLAGSPEPRAALNVAERR